MSDGGKGSKPRPYNVSLDQYGKNFDAIFRKLDSQNLEKDPDDNSLKNSEKKKLIYVDNK